MKAPVFYPGDPVCDALFAGDRARRFRDKQFKEGPIEYLPGKWSNTADTFALKRAYADTLTKLFPPTVDEFGRVSGNGIRDNFYGICHVNGFPMIPATFPVADNRKLREKAGLVNNFLSPEDQLALETLVELSCTGLEPVPLKLKEGSSSMLPHNEKKMTAKIELATFALDHAEKAAQHMQKGDYVTPWQQWYIGGAYATVYRRQSSDGISFEKGVWTPKTRNVADLQYAVTGGEEGNFFPSSKAFGDEVDFKVPAGFFRERNRTAQGGPLGLNAPLMLLAQSIRKNLYSKYSYTFHHTTREQQQNDLRAWKFAIPTDVSQHDQFWPSFVLDSIAKGMERAGVAEWWTTLYKVKSKLPLYVTDVAPGLGNILIGDWRNPDLQPGLPSGNALTDLEGTWVMTWVYALVAINHVAPQFRQAFKRRDTALHFWVQFLTGKLPIVLKDKSDDALSGVTDLAYVPQMKRLLDKMKKGESVSPYMKVSYEHGGAFLGNVLLYPESGDFGGVVLIGNGNSLVTNQVSPEYSVQSEIRDRSKTKRPFPGLAWETLPQVYGTVPCYAGIMDVMEWGWNKVYGESYRSYREKLLEHDKRALLDYARQHSQKIDVASLTQIDIEVLSRPDKLQYQYLPSDVSPGVEEILFKGIPLEVIEPYFRSAYNG